MEKGEAGEEGVYMCVTLMDQVRASGGMKCKRDPSTEFFMENDSRNRNGDPKTFGGCFSSLSYIGIEKRGYT